MSLKFWATYPFFYPDLDRPYTEVIDEVIDIAQAAEDLGYEGISFPEHHFYSYICNPSALVFAALVAAKTTRLRIQTSVLVLPNYHPLALAEEVALVDHISHGRLELGVARGANKYEFDRLGIDWTQSRAMYEESLSTMIDAWTNYDISSDGKFWPFPSVTAIPRPYQKPYPRIWVSAQSQSGVTAVGAAGRNMMTSPTTGSFSPHGDIDQVLKWYDDAVASSGKPRGEVAVLRRLFVDETEEKALQQLDHLYRHWTYYMTQIGGTSRTHAGRFEEHVSDDSVEIKGGSIKPAEIEIERDNIYNTYDDPIITSPEKAIARLKHYESIGVDHLLGLTAFGEPVDQVVHSMEMMAKYVFPAFQDSAV